jgi:hypothetical protein
MKRAGLAAVAAILVAMSLPVAAAATPGPSGAQDQQNDWNESWFAADNSNNPVTVTQTYKAAITGRLTGVQIYCQQILADKFPGGRAQVQLGDVTVAVGGANVTASCGSSDWLIFMFANGPVQTAGHTYTISITLLAGRTVRIGAGQDYANGAAAGAGVPTDFAFGTWVGAGPPPTGTEDDPVATGRSPLWLVPALLAFALGALVTYRRKVFGSKS